MSQPHKPLPPDPADCCGGGCARCVWDIYDQALADWQTGNAAAEVQPAPRDQAGN
jgi:hypothetical protein